MHRSTGLPVDPTTSHLIPPPPPNIGAAAAAVAAAAAIGLPPPALMDLDIIPPLHLEFKELISHKCAERGIIFAPMPGRREAGKQVWFFFLLNINRFLIIFCHRFIEWENYFVTSIVRWL